MTQDTTQQVSLGGMIRTWTLVGIIVIGATFGALGAWAYLAPLARAVVAPGSIKVDSNRKKVQHLDGGVVKELLVRDGDKVVAGDLLIRLDETRASASLAILRGAQNADLAREARLLAERDGAAKIAFPESLRPPGGDIATAKLMQGQTGLFKARRAFLLGNRAILRQQVEQLREKITGIEAQRKAVDRQLGLLKEELKDVRWLIEKGLAKRPRVLALEREQSRLEGERGEFVAGVAETKNAISEKKLEILQLERDFKRGVVDELREVRERLFDVAERVAAAQHVLDNVEIKAPVSGVVVGLGVHTVGGVIRPGDTILELVPSGDKLIIEAKVRPVDVDSLLKGQGAEVRLTGLDQSTTPKLNGIVAYISADIIEDQRNNVSYYTVRIVVPDTEIGRLGEQKLQPGMPVDVIIKTGERTALQYLVKPIADNLARAWREN